MRVAGRAHDPGTRTPSASEATTDGPEAAYLSWLQALEARDAAAACREHAPQLTIGLRRRAILEHRAELGDPCTDVVALLWEDRARQYEPDGVEVTRQTEEKATLAVTFDGPDETVELIRHETRWRILEVLPRTEADDPEAGPERWLAAWCDLTTEMTRGEVVERMGEPSGVYTVSDGGEPQLYWTRHEYDFRAYLESDAPDAAVLELMADHDRLDASDRARLDCPELR